MFCKQYCRLVRYLNLSKNGTFLGHRRQFSSKTEFFTRILDFSSSHETNVFLQKHDYLMKMDPTGISDSYQYLTQIGITTQRIRALPKILCSKRTVLQQRHEILTECGSSTVTVDNLHSYSSLCKRTEESLKCVGIIDNNINLQQRLADQLNVKLQRCKNDASLTKVRMHFLRLFFLENKFMTAKEFEVVERNTHSIKHISYQRTMKILEILTEQLNIPRNQINDYRNVLPADPENLQQLLKIEPIDGVNITDILQTQPRLMLRSCDSIVRTLKQLNEFGISGQSIKNCCDVLMLDSEVVGSRFNEMEHEVQMLAFHPNFLKLIVRGLKVKSRLGLLEGLDKKCINMSALTESTPYFERFAEQKRNINNTGDCVLFLAKNLEMDAEEVTIQIRRHPYYNATPFAEMKQTIDTLKQAGFELQHIRASIQIVLYSRDLIVKRLEKLSKEEPFPDQRWTDLPKRLQLKLVLYYIEAERNFSGDGVWLDRY